MMYLFFDVETNGLPKRWNAPLTDVDNWPRVVQIAWLQCDTAGKEISRKSYIIKPQGFTIPPEAVKVHGITTERAMLEGVPLNMALREFGEAACRSETLVAHNLGFDARIVRVEFLRNEMTYNLFEINKVCTMHGSTDFCRIPGYSAYKGYKWPTLAELHWKLFATEFKNAHDAAADVAACAKCFFELRRRNVL